MKLFVVGGRNLEVSGVLLKSLVGKYSELGVSSVVTDGKKGAGRVGGAVAEFVNLPVTVSNWKDAVVECDELLNIGGGKWGSVAQINLATKLGKKVNVL